MFFLSFPANIDSVGCGPERRKTWRGNVFRLIQDPRATPSFEKSRQRVKSIRCKCEAPIRVPEIQSFSVRPHNETFRIVAVCASNPHCSPIRSMAYTQFHNCNRLC
jgi:hypothetical protein